MAVNVLNKIVLFEYDNPIDLTQFLPHQAGIWKWVISPGAVVVTDDYGQTGYYDYDNAVIYLIKSVKYGTLDLARMDNYNDMTVTDASFYYDPDTTECFFHFPNFEPPLGEQIYIGGAVGYATTDLSGSYFNNIYYEGRVKSVTAISKSLDPLFYGIIKTPNIKITFFNQDGHFDSWRNLNLFGQRARILTGDEGDSYDDFVQRFEGNISNDSTDWETFSLDVIDPRGALTQPLARNMLTLDEWPLLEDGNIDIPKPVHYGVIKKFKAICLDGSPDSPTINTFLITDTEFNSIVSIDEVTNSEGVTVATITEDLDAGTFTILHSDYTSDILVSFTMPFENGVEIIKDMMYRYDGRNFLETFWDLDEVNLAETQSRDSSISITDKSTKLYEAIESICFDIDGYFFNKDNGKYTIRIFDDDRDSVKTILADDWTKGSPKKQNNGETFLTSAIIGYNHQIEDDTYEYYEDTTEEETAYGTYKKFRTEKFETNIPDYAGAVSKGATIMFFSASVRDIISRKVNYSTGESLEIGDFVVADPFVRVDAEENKSYWEVLGIKKDVQKAIEIDLKLRMIKDYDPSVEPVYFTIDDDQDIPLDDDQGRNLIGV